MMSEISGKEKVTSGPSARSHVPAHGAHAHKEKSELPLILFTLCASASVGLVACALMAFATELFMQGGFVPVRASYGLERAGFDPLLQTGAVQPVLAFAALALASIGMLASIAHLAKPLRAPNALRNLASSWLSREILAVSAYWFSCAAWLVACFVLEALALVCCCLSLVLGVLVLVSAAKAYRIHGQPLWDGPETNVELYAAACGAGVPLGCSLAFVALSSTPMPLASDMALTADAMPTYDPANDLAAAPDALTFSIPPYLMTDVLQLVLVVGLALGLLLFWQTGRLRSRRMAEIVDPTPREQIALGRLDELEGPRKLVMALSAAALAVGALSLLVWLAFGYAGLALPALSALLGFAAFFMARARFYRMSVISRHAVRRQLR